MIPRRNGKTLEIILFHMQWYLNFGHKETLEDKTEPWK